MINTSSMRCNGATCFLQRMVPLCAQHESSNAQKAFSPKRATHKQATKQVDAGWENTKCAYLFICVCPKITSPSIPQSQVQLYPSPTEVVGYHCICPGSREGKELHELFSFVYPQKVLLSLLIHCYDLSASTYQRLRIMVSIQPPWLKRTFLTQWINDLCLRSWRVVNMFCLFSGQRQFGLATTRRKSGFLKIG